MKSLSKGVLAAGLIVLGLGMAQKVQAASTDTITLSVTPGGISYAVQITSVNGSGYQFGTVSLSQTTGSTSAIGVKNVGNISEYFVMKAGNSSPDGWVPSAAPGNDAYQLKGLFSGVGGVQPPDASFADNMIISFPTTGSTK